VENPTGRQDGEEKREGFTLNDKEGYTSGEARARRKDHDLHLRLFLSLFLLHSSLKKPEKRASFAPHVENETVEGTR